MTSSLRLCDLGPFDTLRVECMHCGRASEYLPGWLDQMGWRKSEGKVAALRFRCERCQAADGFRVSLFDERGRSDPSLWRERVILPGAHPR